MNFTLSRPVWVLKEFHHHASEWCNACSGSDKDVVVFLWLAWQEESLACRAGDKDFITDSQITEVIATEPEKEIMLVGPFFAELVDESLASCRKNIALSIFAPGRG
jgi:hypothetical protein